MTQQIGTTYARQWQRPDDARREQEEADRIEALTAHSVIQAERDADEKDLLREATEALDEKVADIGGQGLDLGGLVDQVIANGNAQAGARVEAAQLTKEQRQAKAIAAELSQILAPPGDDSPEVDDILGEEEESPLGKPGLYSDELGRTWHLDAAGDWNRLDEDEEEEVEEAEDADED